MKAFDVLVVGFGSKFRDPLGFKRRGAQDGTCLACAGVVWWGAHPCLGSAGFRARGGHRRTSTPYLHYVIHVHLPTNLLY